ncbi:MAG: GMC family oxidoreductase [Vicinamibacterales bacterium]|jgi:choline dehydrogenase-like flavoprotein|nr:GMC family oxidoreductase [Acidobacteriota bacterium]MDP7294702.1 GMC family oxidoreductase [Vicinamibacterales bacterium]MDP7470761.1 GMC family oxidoreductase [Vicinamibacterales bacterium]MDP7673129.1 GMC family oxidoreductase [Vicinamibacterales bacterium]HJO37629.1 GMC family oxidoreductase [Vicinamibacterales bacterium]|tara:strand:- start:1445 stop:3133 length:1689 start_codon:yes stop_codon:yes gene_type:complete
MAAQDQQYDVVIVGSGATGGWAAKQLTEAGLSVAVLEAGRELDPEVDYTEHKRPFDMPFRGRRLGTQAVQARQPVQSLCYQCDEYTNHLFVDDTENPYTTPADRPFTWLRGRHVGGKSIMWARQTYRLSDYDMKAASRDGFGIDWPVDYATLAPYYDIAERFIGVSGRAEGLPQLPDGQFQPPMALTCGEELLKTAIRDEFGRALTIGRCAILTEDLNGRPKCHYCGPCSRGCRTGSYYSSVSSSLPAAEATGRLTLIPNAVVSHVEVDDVGRCRSVYYIDRITRNQREIFGRAVVLCASTLESTRIMLNSTSEHHPTGLANSSGVLGHYLMDHVMGGGASGVLPVLKGFPDTRGNRPNGIYIPRFRNLEERHPDFLRGYGYQGGSNVVKWGHAMAIPGFGGAFKQDVRESRPWQISIGGFGEHLPRYENSCELDTTHVDAWGIPILHISAAYGENEQTMVDDMADAAEEMLRAVGAEDIEVEREISNPGLAIHEVGTARMGDDPGTSVLNGYEQAHDVSNLFVMDGSGLPSSACQNPTITFMALATRACEYMVEEFRASRV